MQETQWQITLLGERRRHRYNFNLDYIDSDRLTAHIKHALFAMVVKHNDIPDIIWLKLDDGIAAQIKLEPAAGGLLASPATQFSKDLLENHYAR